MIISPCTTVYMLCPHVTHVCVWVLSIKSCVINLDAARRHLVSYRNLCNLLITHPPATKLQFHLLQQKLNPSRSLSSFAVKLDPKFAIKIIYSEYNKIRKKIGWQKSYLCITWSNLFINVRENRSDNQQWKETHATLDTIHISTTYIVILFKLLRAYIMLNVFWKKTSFALKSISTFT
jgi:hypothetical protein